MVLGTLASVGLGLLGQKKAGDAQGAANAANEAARLRGRKDLVRGRSQLNRNDRTAIGYLLQALETAGEGEARASEEVARGTRAAGRRILDTRRQRLGSLAASMQSRGLTSSTVLDQARTGVHRATSRDLIDLEGSAANARASLARASGAQKMGALGALAGMFERRGGRLYNISKDLAENSTGIKHVAKPGIAEGYGNLAGLLTDPLNSLSSGWFGKKDQGGGAGDSNLTLGGR